SSASTGHAGRSPLAVESPPPSPPHPAASRASAASSVRSRVRAMSEVLLAVALDGGGGLVGGPAHHVGGWRTVEHEVFHRRPYRPTELVVGPDEWTGEVRVDTVEQLVVRDGEPLARQRLGPTLSDLR